MNDEWHIRIDTHYLDPDAGSGARSKAEELAAGKGGLRRFVERALDVHTEDRSWRKGAVGEERVAARLARKLDERWTVIHDLTIGSKGANLDHLVIGPPGVFALNTKHLTGRVTVYERAILHNGTNHGFLPKARAEAQRVSERLSAATGRSVPVQSVLVWTGTAEVTVKGKPADVRSMGHLRLTRWLQGLPDGAISEGDALRIERAARDPHTWMSKRSSADLRPVRSPERPAVRPTGASADEPVTSSAGAGAVSIRRWRRYGKDRLYANGPDGTRLGFIDVATGEVTLEGPDPTGTLTAELRAARAEAV